MTQLQTIPSNNGNPIRDLAEVSEMMQQYISTDDDAILKMTITRMNKEQSWWRKVFPDAFGRTQNEISLDSLKTAAKNRKAFIDCFVSTQLEIARRRGDALVTATALDLQAKLAAFATQKMDEFTRTILTSKDAFYTQSAAHWLSLEQYKNVPPIYERARQSCDTEICAYLEWVQALRERFTDALTAKVEGKE